MLRRVYSSTVRSLLAATAFTSVTACEPDNPDPAASAEGGDDELRAGRPSGDDIGTRSFGTEPNYSAGICPDGTGCTTIDVNRDGKEDLVRFDHAGIFGDPGTVSVGYSNGWNFGALEPVLSDFCHVGDSCLATDVTGDLLPDLVRFVNGPESELWVAGSKPGGFEPPKLWAFNFCGADQTCTAGDVSGDGIADLVAFAGFTDQSGPVRVYLGGQGPGQTPQTWGSGFCTNEEALCRLGDVDGDGLTDIVEFGRQPNLPVTMVARSNGEGFAKAEQWSGQLPERMVCPAGAECQLGDFNGDWATDVIATFPEQIEPDPSSCSGNCNSSAGACWCDQACSNYGDCCSDYEAICVGGNTCEASCGGSGGSCWCDELCMQYGDCCSDYTLQCGEAPMARQIQMWPSGFDGFGLVELMLDMPCDPGERCWTVDVTGDGREDLITISPTGVLELFPSRDRIDRMRDAAWRLSMLRSDFAVRQAQWRRREIDTLIAEAIPPSPDLAAALPDRFPSASPPASPSPSDPALPIAALPGLEPWPAATPGAIDRNWALARQTALANAVEAEVSAILSSIPSEDSMVWTAEQARWQAALGQVVAARTAIHAPPLAISAASRGVCHNAILHDRIDEDGAVRAEGSYLARYYDSLLVHDDDERVWAALPALTGVVEGMRCLSEQELAGLEAAFVEAVSKTMQDLLDRGQPMLAQLVWDQALPIELLVFDGTKHFAPPQGWRLLQLRIEDGDVVLPPLPEPAADFAAFYVEDGSTCSTVRCQLYKSASRATASGRLLTLDTLGAWLPDLTQREKLRRSSLYPEQLLDAMVDLRRLGEGDCALIELNFFDQTCKSRRTCEFADELAAMPNDLGLVLRPGESGSLFTHFGTARADLDTVNECGSDGGGGGTPPSSCFGPELRGHAGRFFPLDPELDRVMSCALEVFDAPTPSATPVLADLDFDPRCLLKDPPVDDPLPGEEPSASDAETLALAKNAGRDLLESNSGAAREYGYDREQIISVIMAKTGASRDQVLDAMGWVAGNPLSATATIGSTDSLNPLQTRTRLDADGNVLDMQLEVNQEVLDGDLAALGDGVLPSDALAREYMIRGVLHESVHMVLHRLSDQGHAASIDDLNPFHHDITDILGLTRTARSCDPSSNECRSACGFSDARISRFRQCISNTDPAPIDRCEFALDYCEERSAGNLEFNAGTGCGAPDIAFPPVCALVNCADSSSVATACCGGGGGGGAPSLYPNISSSPGPHPGDPDGPYGGVPGGPGGVPFPPFPSLF